MLRSVPAALLLGLCLFAIPVLAEGLRYRVEGVDKRLRENIRAYLGAAPDDAAIAERFISLAPSRTQQALETLGYYSAEVNFDVDRGRTPWLLTVSVSPGEPLHYTDATIVLGGEAGGDSVFGNLVGNLAPKVGDAVHHGRYESFKEELQQIARRRGYFDARFVESHIDIDARARTAALTLEFDAGRRYRFGPVRVDEAIIDSELLERLSPLKRGDFYEQQKLIELRQHLLRLGYFSSVTVLPVLPERDYPEIPLQVALSIAPRHSYELGVGYSTDTRQRLSLNWRSPRLNRWGHSQESVLRWSPVNPQVRVTYSIPLRDPANDVLQFTGRIEDNQFGDLQSQQRAFRVRRERTTGGRVFGLQGRVLNERWGVFSDDFAASYALAGASLSSRSRRGNAVDPSRGLSQFYSIEAGAADAGSDDNLLRLYASLTGLRRLTDDWRLVGRSEAGLVWTGSDAPQQLPPSLAFFAGGDNSIRGFGYQTLGREVAVGGLSTEKRGDTLAVGGTRLLTGSLEVQRYFNDNWRGALFVDAGDAFDSGDFDMNVGVGLGVHYLSPVGALRFEVANPVTESGGSWRVHINIGAEF